VRAFNIGLGVLFLIAAGGAFFLGALVEVSGEPSEPDGTSGIAIALWVLAGVFLVGSVAAFVNSSHDD
jgi:hypothetical protein